MFNYDFIQLLTGRALYSRDFSARVSALFSLWCVCMRVCKREPSVWIEKIIGEKIKRTILLFLSSSQGARRHYFSHTNHRRIHNDINYNKHQLYHLVPVKMPSFTIDTLRICNDFFDYRDVRPIRVWSDIFWKV